MSKHTILYYSGTTGSHFFGRTFWWPRFLRQGFRRKACGVLFTYADEKETRKCLADLSGEVRDRPIKKPGSRALFSGGNK